jgi:ABC-type multidrug transport system fused ATPase/permease subunit
MSDLTLAGLSQDSKTSPYRQYQALLARYLRPQLGRVLGMAALLLGGIALQLANPQVIRYFLDTAQSGHTSSLLTAAGLFIAFSIFQQGFQLAATYASQNVGWTATNHLRADLAWHCLRMDLSFHKRRTPGELIERIDGDVTGLANFFSEFTVRLVGNGLLVLGILALLLRENAWLGLGMAIYTLLTLVIMSLIQRIATPRWTAERQANADLSGFLEERISGVEELRATGAEAYAMRRLYGLLRNWMAKRRLAWVTSSLAYTSTNLIYVISYASGLAVGIYLFTHGAASLGAAYLITYYVGMLADPLQNMREQVQDLQKSAASIQRIQDLFELQPAVTNPPTPAQPLPPGSPGLCFEDVSFRYLEDEAVQGQIDGFEEKNENVPANPLPANQPALILDSVSFEVQPGRILGILGRTGSGKSTLARLLFRLYDPIGGAIRLGGVDLRAAALADLRSRVGMVTQDVQLFNATIRENLTFFNPCIASNLLEEGLRTLQLWDWVQALPEGLNTRLAADGQGLSAGEAQLLAFTRVFLKNPGLVILDEASSRLDPATETLMERAVDRLFAGRTGVVIAHRLKTVQRADDILILETGRVVEYGPRQTLARDPHTRFYSLLQTGLEEALA